MKGNNQMHEKEKLIEHLTMTGQKTYYTNHREIMEEMKPEGNINAIEWNEASAEALIKTVAAMIADAVLYFDGDAQ